MKSCDEFEVVIEKRVHGAATEEERGELDLHLASCVSCRDYEAATRQMESVMAETVAARGRGGWAGSAKGGTSANVYRPAVMAGIGALVVLSGLIKVWPLLVAWVGVFVWLRYFGSGRDPLSPSRGAGFEGDWLSESRARLDSLIRFFRVTSWLLVGFLVFLGASKANAFRSFSGFQQELSGGPGVGAQMFENFRWYLLFGLVVQASSIIAILAFIRRVVLSSYRSRRRALAS